MRKDSNLAQAVKNVADAEIVDAREYRDESIKNFPGDKRMADMFRADCRDRISAARALKRGDIDEAYDIMHGMDTAARDGITDAFWDLVNSLKKLSY